jgi:hypothetical protein
MMYDTPVAVLVDRQGYEHVKAVTLPPPHEIYIPIRQRLSIHEAADPTHARIPRRTFRLSRQMRTSSVRWWHVYNEGRSRTPEDGFVYFEDQESAR